MRTQLKWADLVHEIRTPLTNIRGYLEAMLHGVIPPDSASLSAVYEEVERLERLVSLLNEARQGAGNSTPLPDPDCSAAADAGPSLATIPRVAAASTAELPPVTPVRGPVNPDRVADRLVRLCEPAAHTRGLRLETDLQGGPAMVAVSADVLAQVMGNLLQNALRYTEDGGCVRIESKAAGEHYRFACRNTGSYISPDELPLIFQRGFRGEAARRTCPGTGVGLAVVRELVEAHGGWVGAGSTGGWTEIWFVLPLAAGRH